MHCIIFYIDINYYYSLFVFSLLLPWGASISQFKPVVKCLIYFRYLFLCIFEIITGLYSCSQWLAIFDNEQLFLHTRLVAQEYSAGFCMVVTLIPLAPAEMLPFRPSYTTTEKHHYFIKPSAVIALNIPKWTILTYFYSEFHLNWTYSCSVQNRCHRSEWLPLSMTPQSLTPIGASDSSDSPVTGS